MATKTANTIYRTAKGAQIDMQRMINQNELTIAVGNAKVHARGDKLGPNGEIIKKREEIQAMPTTGKKNIVDMDPEGNE